MFAMQETIRPSADLRNHYNEISKQCREGKEAVIITVNGRGDTVSLSYEEYKNMKSRIELLEILAEAEDDVRMVVLSQSAKLLMIYVLCCRRAKLEITILFVLILQMLVCERLYYILHRISAMMWH